MKKYTRIFAVLLILFVLLIFSACKDEPAVIYPIDSARYYVETEEYGLITTKTDVNEYIEVVYTSADGTIKKEIEFLSEVIIGNENIITVIDEGKALEYRNVTLTEDYYSKLCGFQYVNNETPPAE